MNLSQDNIKWNENTFWDNLSTTGSSGGEEIIKLFTEIHNIIIVL